MISTHVLDTNKGVPGAGIPVELLLFDHDTQGWITLGSGATDKDGNFIILNTGRIKNLTSLDIPKDSKCKLVFELSDYFKSQNLNPFFPVAELTFIVQSGHYHVPLLLSPYSYTTYRGS
jgi:5-hydroxyisourate hydrolase